MVEYGVIKRKFELFGFIVKVVVKSFIDCLGLFFFCFRLY